MYFFCSQFYFIFIWYYRILLQLWYISPNNCSSYNQVFSVFNFYIIFINIFFLTIIAFFSVIFYSFYNCNLAIKIEFIKRIQQDITNVTAIFINRISPQFLIITISWNSFDKLKRFMTRSSHITNSSFILNLCHY